MASPLSSPQYSPHGGGMCSLSSDHRTLTLTPETRGSLSSDPRTLPDTPSSFFLSSPFVLNFPLSCEGPGGLAFPSLAKAPGGLAFPSLARAPGGLDVYLYSRWDRGDQEMERGFHNCFVSAVAETLLAPTTATHSPTTLLLSPASLPRCAGLQG